MSFPRASFVLLGASLALPLGAVFAQSPAAPAEVKSGAQAAGAPSAGGEAGASVSAKPAAPAKPVAERKPRIVKLSMAEGLRFEPPRFEAKPFGSR